MYTQILEHSLKNVHNEKDKQQLVVIFRQVVGAIVNFFEPLSVITIVGLLAFNESTIQRRLHNLHSILKVPDGQEYPIRLFHPSFRDFLLNNERCCNQNFWVDEKETHGTLVKCCLRLMSSNLTRDICDLRAPGALASEVNSC